MYLAVRLVRGQLRGVCQPEQQADVDRYNPKSRPDGRAFLLSIELATMKLGLGRMCTMAHIAR